METLQDVVRSVYRVLRKTEKYMSIRYDYIEEILPHDIFFITTKELEEMFPDNTPKEREYYITQAKGAVCLMQIGDQLENGKPHDGRAPDYDDWEDRAQLPFQKAVLNGELPYTIGGGIGQSRICMFFLRKAHIGEVQCSVWPNEVAAECEKNGIHLL